MALTGTFEDIGFAELLQLLNVGHKSGRLYIWTETERAELFVMSGEVVRARLGSKKGPEVVYRVLGWRSGEFSFERTDDPVVREIMESTEALILEGMKRFDEWERVETEVPDTDTVLRQRVSAVNEQYDLLSSAAQSLLRLVDARRTVASLVRESGLEPAEALAAIAELMAEEIVEEWSEQHQPGDVLRANGRLPLAQGGLDLLTAASVAGHGGSRATVPWELRHKETTMGTNDTSGQGGKRA